MSAAPESPVHLLRRVTLRLLAGELGPDGERVGGKLQAYLDTAAFGVTFEEAAGLEAVGGLAWWHQDSLARRDDLVRELAERYFPDLNRATQARAICSAGRRYAAAGWRRDRINGLPPGQQGGERELLFKLCSTGRFPICERQIQTILADQK